MVGPRRMLAVSAARLIETNRIGPLPDAPLLAKVRSLAKPVPVTLDGPLGNGAAAPGAYLLVGLVGRALKEGPRREQSQAA